MESKNQEYLKEKILKFGASLVGFAHLGEALPKEYSSYPYGISIAKAFDPSIIQMIRKEGPTIDYFAETSKTNALLTSIARKSANLIKEMGYNAIALPSTITERGQYNRETMSVAFPHKTAATSSGLGFIGKSALFVSNEFGPSLRLCTVLTDMVLDVAIPVYKSECGDCMICKEACPGKAISGKNWSRGTPRDEFFDARSCFETAKNIVKKKTGINSDTCGICLAACKMNRLEGYDLSYKIEKPGSYLIVGNIFLKRSNMESLPIPTRLSLAQEAQKALNKALDLKKEYPEAAQALSEVEANIESFKNI